jgi:hypothetical protein
VKPKHLRHKKLEEIFLWLVTTTLQIQSETESLRYRYYVMADSAINASTLIAKHIEESDPFYDDDSKSILNGKKEQIVSVSLIDPAFGMYLYVDADVIEIS